MKRLFFLIAISVSLFSCSKQKLDQPIKVEIPKETVATEETGDSEVWPGGMGYPCPSRQCYYQINGEYGRCLNTALMCQLYCEWHNYLN